MKLEVPDRFPIVLGTAPFTASIIRVIIRCAQYSTQQAFIDYLRTRSRCFIGSSACSTAVSSSDSENDRDADILPDHCDM